MNKATITEKDIDDVINHLLLHGLLSFNADSEKIREVIKKRLGFN